MDKFKPDPSKMYRELAKRSAMQQESELDKFIRNRKVNKKEQMTELGNVRPQKTVYHEIEDEELGSTLLFKVPRHCRNQQLLQE